MRIGILGTGHIGKTLVRKLSAAGHDVKVANSRGPHTIDEDILVNGARAVTSAEAVVGVDVVILSTPLGAIPQISPLLADVPSDTVVIDTSNYYPGRDGVIAAIEAGKPRANGSQDSLAALLLKLGTPSPLHPLPKKAWLPGRRGGSPFPLLPMVTGNARSRRHSSTRRASTPFMVDRSLNRGVSSPARQATART